MKIFERVPRDWRDLQVLVGQLFEELGYQVQIGQKVQLLRGGTKEVDVRIIDNGSPPSVYLCECKHWKARVDQEVVHAFRTVVDDQGANHGFIISTSGFQSGARSATQNTTTKVLTFEELQQRFFEPWRLAMAQRHMPAARSLKLYSDPSEGQLPVRRFGIEDMAVMRRLGEANRPLTGFSPSVLHRGGELPLPITLPVLDRSFAEVGTVVLSTYRQFYDWIAANTERAIADYRRHLGLVGTGNQSSTEGRPIRPAASSAIEAGDLPPLPSFEPGCWTYSERLATARKFRLEELLLTERNVHRGLHLRFVKTGGDAWHALRDSVYSDGTACLTARVNGAVIRCHELDDDEGTHDFLVWYFEDGCWSLQIWTHSLAFEGDLNLTEERLENY